MALAKLKLGFPIPAVLQLRNYRLLCVGQGCSLLGEQINLIALSWLALQITGNALALGSVLAVAGIPPALLMLVSGVITDRFSARSILLLVEALRLLLVCALVALLLAADVTLTTLYALALCLGLLAALGTPAAGSIVPALVPRATLQPANSLYQGLSQLAAFVGPACAGLVIASAGGSPGATTAISAAAGPVRPSGPVASTVVPAFALYALGLVVSVATLLLMQVPARTRQEDATASPGVLPAVASGWRYAWEDPLLRLLLPAILGANLLIAGPLAVGVPVLATLRLPQGAAAFGFITAGWGGGNLLGALAAGAVRQSRGLGLSLCTLFVVFGAGLAAFGWIRSMWLGFLVLFLMGAGNGYLGVILRTLLHQRTPAHLLGRVMSVFFFAHTLLVPLSQTVSGAAIDLSLDGLFIGSGVLFAALAAWFALSPAPRLFEQEVARTREEPAI